MISVVSFGPSHIDSVVTFWRLLHPDWTWLENSEEKAKLFGSRNGGESIDYVVQRDGTVVASVFSKFSGDKMVSLDKSVPRNRFIIIDARPADVSSEWLDIVLASLVEADRGQSDIWHVANATEVLSPVLAPLLEEAGFVRHSSLMRMEWSVDCVIVTDPSPAHLERYAGGDPDIDRTMVDLHNSSYRASRLAPPATLERLWNPRPGLEAHEFVLARENHRIVGYSEWSVVDGEAWISSYAAARSHWGTAVGSAVGTKAMQVLVEVGHNKINSTVRSNNTASMRLHLKYGWKVASVSAHTFVRKL